MNYVSKDDRARHQRDYIAWLEGLSRSKSYIASMAPDPGACAFDTIVELRTMLTAAILRIVNNTLRVGGIEVSDRDRYSAPFAELVDALFFNTLEAALTKRPGALEAGEAMVDEYHTLKADLAALMARLAALSAALEAAGYPAGRPTPPVDKVTGNQGPAPLE